MIRQNIARIALLATTLLVAISSPVAARQWKDRTIMTFSEPVKVPGAVLSAGAYVFELVDPASATDVIKITDRAGSRIYALTHAVPTIRSVATEDVILLFTPMDHTTMPAIRGWYPQGGRHGYLFVYPRDEARLMANRTRSLVLSRDVDDTSRQGGTIVVFDPLGGSSEWVQETSTQDEWNAWVEAEQARRSSEADRNWDESTTAIVADSPKGLQVKVDEVEDHPERYFDKVLSIDGKVDEVYGPHLFELDQPDWGAESGDLLVYVPELSMAAVSEDDRVTVTGSLERFSRSSLIFGSRWMEVDGILDKNLDREPVLVATRIVGGDSDRVMLITPASDRSSSAPSGLLRAITDAGLIGRGGSTLVGRRVDLPSVRILSVSGDDGLFVRAGNRTLFVLVDDPDQMKFRIGDDVRLEGTVLAMPAGMARDLWMPSETNAVIYVYADQIGPRK